MTAPTLSTASSNGRPSRGIRMERLVREVNRSYYALVHRIQILYSAKVDYNAIAVDWTMYANLMKEADEAMVRGWKEEVDTLLVFVRHQFRPTTALSSTSRRVCFLRWSPRSLSKHTSYCKTTPRNVLYNCSNKFLNSSHRARMQQVIQVLSWTRLLSTHPYKPYVSTHSGSLASYVRCLRLLSASWSSNGFANTWLSSLCHPNMVCASGNTAMMA